MTAWAIIVVFTGAAGLAALILMKSLGKAKAENEALRKAADNATERHKIDDAVERMPDGERSRWLRKPKR